MPKAQKHILIVEDDAAIRMLLDDLLTERGYSVAVAYSGTQALRAIRERPPDLMLLDLMLPDMNGWSFLRLKAHERDLTLIPVLVVSAAPEAGLDEARDLGAPVFLPKPFENDQLLNEVERLCAGPVRQCAWCRRVMDRYGKFRLRSGRKLRWATHGICPSCKDRERKALISHPTTSATSR